MSQQWLLSISHLHVTVDDNPVISDLSFDLLPGKTYVLMGPNGSGKSSLAHTIMGYPSYTITHGSISYENKDLTLMSMDQRARTGIFLAHQHPLTIPGVRMLTFLHAAHRAMTGQELSIEKFATYVTQQLTTVGLDASFLHRNLNEGFSGGEKKKLELLQCLIFKPKLIMLDEIDSGLDNDMQKMLAPALAKLRNENSQTTLLIITHQERILHALKPDTLYLINKGIIVENSSRKLPENINNHRYKINFT